MAGFPAYFPRLTRPTAADRPGLQALLAVWCFISVVASAAAGQDAAPARPGAAGVAPARPGAAGVEPPPAAVKPLKLSTSDGVALAAWYYPVATPDGATDKDEARPAPVVILLHDLGGSHKAVEPLALALQSNGIAVVAPDLRGHGATPAAAGEGVGDAAALKKTDFDRMTASAGGRVREQAAAVGDVEAVRNWIAGGPEAGKLDLNRLFVVGSGLGAAVGAQWTILDFRWPDLASGPQGRQVRGLVFVSPAWTTRGFTISPALGVEPVQRSLPVLVIGGAEDVDAVKIYDQLKKKRPDGWSEKRSGQEAPSQAAKLGAEDRPSLYLRQFDSGLSGDRLAAYVPKDPRAGHPAAIIAGFVNAVTAAEP